MFIDANSLDILRPAPSYTEWMKQEGVNSKNQQLLKKSTIVDFIHNCGLYCGLFFVDHIVDYFVDYFVDIFNNKRTVLRKTDG